MCSEWINIQNKQPISETDDFEHYDSINVIVFNGKSVFEATFHAGRKPWFWSEFERDGRRDYNITHWMPLPEAPK